MAIPQAQAQYFGISDVFLSDYFSILFQYFSILLQHSDRPTSNNSVLPALWKCETWNGTKNIVRHVHAKMRRKNIDMTDAKL